MHARFFMVICAFVLPLVGCGPTIWTKPGAGTQEFAADRYSCERDSRQSGGFGTGLVGAIEVQEYFNRCLVAHGWEVQGATPTPRQAAAAAASSQNQTDSRDLKVCVARIRENPQYQIIIPNMADIETGKFTMSQISNMQKLTSKESSALLKYTEESSICWDAFLDSVEKRNDSAAQIFREGFSDTKIARAKAIRHEISWGELNSYTQALSDTQKSKLNSLH